MVDPTKFYVVTGGRCSSMFTSWDRVLDAVVGYPGAKFEKFSTRPEAEQFMRARDNVRELNTPTGWNGPAYAVAVGRYMEIFRTHHEALRQTLRYSGNSMKKFRSCDEAVEFLDHHNWRKMPPNDDDTVEVKMGKNVDETSDAETASEEEQPNDSASWEVFPKRDREEDRPEDLDIEGHRPAQRRKTNDSQQMKKILNALCFGRHTTGSRDELVIESSCIFPTHPEWNEVKTVDPNITVTRAGLLAVLDMLSRVAQEDPRCEMNVSIITLNPSVRTVLRDCARERMAVSNGESRSPGAHFQGKGEPYHSCWTSGRIQLGK